MIGKWLKGHYERGRQEGRRQAAAQLAAQGRKPWGQPWGETYGSAYFMTPRQIVDAGAGLWVQDSVKEMEAKAISSLMLGYTDLGKEVCMDALRWPGHAITIAPTRSGKGVSAVIPNLLFYNGSVIVNDIKGENFAVTSRYRRLIGHEVVKLAPFDDDSDSWNPFDSISRGDNAWEDAATMAALLIPPGSGEEQFWNNEARNFLTGMILYMHLGVSRKDRTMSRLRHLLTQHADDLNDLVTILADGDATQVARAANAFRNATEKTRANILSTLNSYLGIFDSPRLEKVMERSDFDFSDFKDKRISCYFVLPPERLANYAPLVRLFMGMAIQAMTRSKRKGDHPVLFMLDEFPALGRVKVVEDGIAYLAGYDVRLWLFAQDLKQVAAIYGDKAQSIIANCAVKQFFGVADYETAELVSRLCGETEVPSISYSQDGVKLGGSNISLNAGARPLMATDEVMNLDNSKQLLLFSNLRPIIATKLHYLKDARMFSTPQGPLFDPNPFH